MDYKLIYLKENFQKKIINQSSVALFTGLSFCGSTTYGNYDRNILLYLCFSSFFK